MTATRAEIVATLSLRYGIRLDPNDPIFMLVDLNQMLVEDKLNELQMAYQGAGAAVAALVKTVETVEVAFQQDIRSIRRTASILSECASRIGRDTETIGRFEAVLRQRTQSHGNGPRPTQYPIKAVAVAVLCTSLLWSVAWIGFLSLNHLTQGFHNAAVLTPKQF